MMNGLTTDIESGDLLIEDGSAVLSESEGQTAETVLVSMRGELKEVPLVGGEARLLLSGERDVMWPGEVKKMLKSVGVEATKVSVSDDGVVTVE